MIENRPYMKILTHVVLILGVFFLCFPVWMALVASTHGPDALSRSPIPLWFGDQGWENYAQLLSGGVPEAGGVPVLGMMLNSLIMALSITIGKIAVSIIAAYAIVYFRFPFRMGFFWLIFITLMLPVEVRILPTFDVIVRLDMLNSYAGLSIPLIASATATFLFRQFFMTVPDELVEAARIDRAGPIRFFIDILIPLSRTNIAALFIILFIFGWNQYLWPLIVTTDEAYYTIVMGIQRMTNSGEALPVWHYIMGTAVLAMIPPVFVVLAMQKLFVKGLVEQEK
ncbi:sn-glycerol-3-phosphate ABC transporter permease UgpE [Pikeienuella piscinae]|uniref:sn-glycerol-3-phosphate transport system permease protein UgpE n=1 Tax=Pikeienuella piscinae TaxID=2748098 RepID=A0A7L5BT23_9RHOB|nr:sn-glycerol-3-phosphate ABC transporter permease UgpE [Pikeienuella piscinae]QIE54021.1 sn-glycerol-3-phosphate ABC transporter permease UgpE [Pikeienuella piscinae]